MTTDAIGVGGSQQKDAAVLAEFGKIGGTPFDGSSKIGTSDGDRGRRETVCPV